MCDDNHTVQEEDPVLVVHLHNLQAIHQALVIGAGINKGPVPILLKVYHSEATERIANQWKVTSIRFCSFNQKTLLARSSDGFLAEDELSVVIQS